MHTSMDSGTISKLRAWIGRGMSKSSPSFSARTSLDRLSPHVLELELAFPHYLYPPFNSSCGQFFFLHRTYQLSKNTLISAAVAVLILFTFATGTYEASFVWGGNLGSPDLTTWTIVSSWCGVATDVVLCSTLMWYMWKTGSDNHGFRKSTDLVCPPFFFHQPER